MPFIENIPEDLQRGFVHLRLSLLQGSCDWQQWQTISSRNMDTWIKDVFSPFLDKRGVQSFGGSLPNTQDYRI